MQETRGDNDQEPRDDLTVILGFAQLLSGSREADGALRFAIDHGWLGEDGQPTVSGSQLARALQQQSRTRTALRLW
jgi:hypothetical protein